MDSKPSARIKWTNQREFVLTVAGCCIGLGNVWRFPYLCYKYGGGAFLVPYFTFVLLVAVPTMLLEFSMGQFMSLGGIKVWKIVPIAKGIGFAGMILSSWFAIYYVVILAWALFYFLHSATGNSPWSNCDNSFNSPCCSSEYNQNGTLVIPEACNSTAQLPETEFWFQRTLNISSGFEDVGRLRLELLGCLVIMWVLVFFCVFKGIKSTGKSAYVTATMPMIMLLFLVGNGVSLPGASIGLRYYLKPVYHKLVDPEVWLAAGSQVIFSYVLGTGVLTTLGSFNKYDYNIFKWTSRLCFLNCSASFLAGIAIFSVLGNMSYETGIPMETVGRSGPGLAFIAYPRALKALPYCHVWFSLFFGMLIILGLASECSVIESISSMIVDFHQSWFDKKKHRRPIFVFFVCVLFFLMALPLINQGGIFLFNLYDSYSVSGICVLVVVISQSIAMGWLYGVEKFYDDLFDMFGHKMDPRRRPWSFFGICWKWITPAICSAVLLAQVISVKKPSYSLPSGIYQYPASGTAVAAFMTLSTFELLTLPNLPVDHPSRQELKLIDEQK
ncbi:Oidioi.mRNA.OKI2018_I69.chr1.g1440.t1.cds [Oikopleura dioica]|uniref:Oidioi.mRNA.OKI2018_I69.chr1.g1440.t1.cds n=1 Tax=Oikopleura dioica TaxID=34765 RepID=A0ABN7ST52_OIKDI|nr:Oidioi.mRNA.OKI2018_I69.chr1.g1440.t1.cds [Oikopleura dioica]